MNKVRFHYSKTGTARYLSHLDLMATIKRGFLRAGLELSYSQGFNPHPYMSVALPLPVGCESLCELIDVGLTEDIIPELKDITLPDGLEILKAYKPTRKFNDISWVKISIKMHYVIPLSKGILDKLKQRFSEQSIILLKKTKNGLKELDIAPFVKDVMFSNEQSKIVTMTARISAQNPTLNVTDLESALENELKPDHTDMKRVAIYDVDMIPFR